MARLSEAQASFLREAHLGVLTTLRADGSPHSTVLWVDAIDGDVVVNTARGRAKERHLLADARVSLAVFDAQDFQRWISVDGTATLVDEGARAHIEALAVRYQGAVPFSSPRDGEQRVIVRIAADRIESKGC